MKKKAAPKKRRLPAKPPEKKAEPKYAEELYKDIRLLLKRGGSGDATIYGALILGKSEGVPMALFGRVWVLLFEEGEDRYVARPCLTQTDGWIPQKGNRVRFERQPKGVHEEYIFATLLP